jgi:hypothetical protein
VGQSPGTGIFTMLREDEESFNLNQLWVVQGRLSSLADPAACRL